MKKIIIILSLIAISFSSCFERGLNEFDIQFVNDSPVDVRNLKFFDDGKPFVIFNTTIGNGNESEFKSSPTMVIDYISEFACEMKYNGINLPLALPLTHDLGSFVPEMSYSVHLDSNFCFRLYERDDTEVSFYNDSNKRRVGVTSCIDENYLPSLPF